MNRTSATAVVLLALTFGAVAQAWSVRIDASGGPAELEELVDAAERRWREAGADLAAVERTILVRYASGDSMGPDALTLVVTGGPPGVDLEVWVRSDAGPDAPLSDALVVAIGIALGGTPGVGVLDPALGQEPRVPTADDVAALAPPGGVPGDVTGDGTVGFADLLALAEAWGRRGVNLPADLDGDGTVDDADLAILREHYGFEPLPSERSPGASAPADDDAQREAAMRSREGRDAAGDATGDRVEDGDVVPDDGGDEGIDEASGDEHDDDNDDENGDETDGDTDEELQDDEDPTAGAT